MEVRFSPLLLITHTILLPLLLSPSHSSPTPTHNTSKALCTGCTMAESLEFLYYHNLVRLAHWELPLSWDAGLAAYAARWAEQRRDDCRPEHSFPEGQFGLGENIFWGGGGGWRPRDAVAAWAAERADYSYAANACSPGRVCGHYTQVVWRRTASVGCARVVCDGGDVFMTCNYYPPGNVVGERPY